MLALCLALAGCGTVELFGRYDLPEKPGTAEAPWPRLVDVPSAPPVGTYTAAVPDPAEGVAAQQDLSVQAIVADIRRRDAQEPVISDAERARLLRQAQLQRQ
ncbi:MAG: hypothetical protein AAF409_17320 [Pseudomonadota bacterium]